MTFAFLIFQTFLISLSGVMAPGPMTAVTVARGSQSPHAGVLVALGHAAVEFPLMIAIYFGMSSLMYSPVFKNIMTFAGALYLFYLCYKLARSNSGISGSDISKKGSAFMDGVLLSAANPYFMIWWLTVGSAMIINGAGFGMGAVAAVMVTHWLTDFFWSYFLSFVSHRGTRFFGAGFYRIVSIVCMLLILGFAVMFMIDAVSYHLK